MSRNSQGRNLCDLNLPVYWFSKKLLRPLRKNNSLLLAGEAHHGQPVLIDVDHFTFRSGPVKANRHAVKQRMIAVLNIQQRFFGPLPIKKLGLDLLVEIGIMKGDCSVRCKLIHYLHVFVIKNLPVVRHSNVQHTQQTITPHDRYTQNCICNPGKLLQTPFPGVITRNCHGFPNFPDPAGQALSLFQPQARRRQVFTAGNDPFKLLFILPEEVHPSLSAIEQCHRLIYDDFKERIQILKLNKRLADPGKHFQLISLTLRTGEEVLHPLFPLFKHDPPVTFPLCTISLRKCGNHQPNQQVNRWAEQDVQRFNRSIQQGIEYVYAYHPHR